MPVLFKRNAPSGEPSPFWYAGFYYRDVKGRTRRFYKSTKCADHKGAMEVAKAWEDATRKGERGRANLDYVRDVMEELTELFTGERASRYTVETWFEQWLENKKPTVGASSFERYSQVKRDFLAHLGRRASANVETLRTRDLIAFRDAEHGAGKSGRSVNHTLKIVGVILGKAHRAGVIGKNPAADVERLTEEDSVREPFTPEQVRKLIAAAPDEAWRVLITLGFYTGARIGDLSQMRWENVDLQTGVLRFSPQKTRRTKTAGGKGKELFIPLHEAAKDVLLALPSHDDGRAFVLPSLAAYRVGGRAGLSTLFGGIMAKAGVEACPVGERRGKKGKRSARFSFHSLRHTFASIQANEGVSTELRKRLTGHSDDDIHARYSHVEIETLRGAVDVLPDLRRGSDRA